MTSHCHVDVWQEPAPIKNNGDFVRRNRALIHHASSFNSLLRQLRKEALDKGDTALLVNVEKMSYANLYHLRCVYAYLQ
jgi:hypothetical protein